MPTPFQSSETDEKPFCPRCCSHVRAHVDDPVIEVAETCQLALQRIQHLQQQVGDKRYPKVTVELVGCAFCRSNQCAPCALCPLSIH